MIYVIFTSPSGAVAKYCDEYVSVCAVCVCVCLSVCPRGYLRNHKPHALSLPMFVHVAYGRGKVLLLRRCDTLRTSGFVDDISQSNQSNLFAISLVHNITIFMSSHCVWLDRQAITSHLCLPMTSKPKK